MKDDQQRQGGAAADNTASTESSSKFGPAEPRKDPLPKVNFTKIDSLHAPIVLNPIFSLKSKKFEPEKGSKVAPPEQFSKLIVQFLSYFEQ